MKKAPDRFDLLSRRNLRRLACDLPMAVCFFGPRSNLPRWSMGAGSLGHQANCGCFVNEEFVSGSLLSGRSTTSFSSYSPSQTLHAPHTGMNKPKYAGVQKNNRRGGSEKLAPHPLDDVCPNADSVRVRRELVTVPVGAV